MRFLEQDQMLVMLPADSGEEQQALARANILWHSGNGWDQERLPDLTRSGFLQTAGIHQAGEAVAVLWYRVERERLIVDTLISLSKGRTTSESWALLWNGVEKIARARGCNQVEGTTQRAALARVYQAGGFEVRGLVMRKELSNV